LMIDEKREKESLLSDEKNCERDKNADKKE
jgi:hypothetical protein